MPSNYKRLGDYIQVVNIRNKDLENLPLMGLSVSQVFFPTIANLVGTDMSTYKVVYKKYYDCGFYVIFLRYNIPNIL